MSVWLSRLELDWSICNIRHIIWLNDWDHAQKLVIVNRILYLHIQCTTFGVIFYLHIYACRYNMKTRFVTQNPGNRIWATLLFCASYMNCEGEPSRKYSLFYVWQSMHYDGSVHGLKIVQYLPDSTESCLSTV